jgi:hypothetical protein
MPRPIARAALRECGVLNGAAAFACVAHRTYFPHDGSNDKTTMWRPDKNRHERALTPGGD